MVEIVARFQRIPGYETISHISARLKAFAGKVFSTDALPNESRIIYIARKVLAFLGAALLVAAFIPIVPILLAGYIIYAIGQPSSTYKLGQMPRPLNENDLLAHLKILQQSKRPFHTLELIHGGNEAFAITRECAEALRDLKPKRLILKNCSITQDILDCMEAPKEYFVKKSEKPEGNVAVCTYDRQDKINTVVLSLDDDEILKSLKDLASRNQRVTHLYLMKEINDSKAQFCSDVHKYIAILKPVTTSLLLNNPNKFSAEAYTALLSPTRA